MNVDECQQFKKTFFLILMEASQDGCSLISSRFLPESIGEWRYLFYIVIDAL